MRHSGGAIARAFARVVESNRSGHSYAPEGSAPRVVLNRLLDRIFAELPALVLEAKILKLRSPLRRLFDGPSHKPDDRCVRGSGRTYPDPSPCHPRLAALDETRSPAERFGRSSLILLTGDRG